MRPHRISHKYENECTCFITYCKFVMVVNMRDHSRATKSIQKTTPHTIYKYAHICTYR